MGGIRFAAVVTVLLSILGLAGISRAGAPSSGGMAGMHGGGAAEAHGAERLGDRIFDGKIGPWHGEGRLVDMRAMMKKIKASEKMMKKMKSSHHVMFFLEDPATHSAVVEGKGRVTITDPDRKTSSYNLVGMQGHFGADVVVGKPGEYRFSVEIESGRKKGSATFGHLVR